MKTHPFKLWIWFIAIVWFKPWFVTITQAQLAPAYVAPNRSPSQASAMMSGCRTISTRTGPFRIKQEWLSPFQISTEDPVEEVEIDILFVYTQAALNGAGSQEAMIQEIDLAVDFANQVYQASGTGVTFRKVQVELINYVESGDILIDRNRLRDRHAQVRDVLELQESFQADVVCLLVEKDNFWGGGIAFLPAPESPSPERYSYIVVYRAHLISTDYELLAHELGHLLGCDHNRSANSGAALLYPFAYGHHFEVEDVLHRSIMAYPPGVLSGLFSSPDLFYRNVPTGVAHDLSDEADNVSVIRALAPFVASYYNASSRVEFDVDRHVSVAEEETDIRLSVIRTGDVSGPAQVSVQVEQISARQRVDFNLVSRVLEFEPQETRKELAVHILQDDLLEGPESLKLKLRLDPSSMRSGVGLGSRASVELTIVDDETSWGSMPSTVRVEEGQGVVQIPIRIDATGIPESAYPIQLDYEWTGLSASDGLDFTAEPGSLMFASGESEKIIEAMLMDDALAESEEEFKLSIAGLDCVIQIQDDDRSGSRVGRSVWNANVKGEVKHILPLKDGRLMISGDFNEVDGQERLGIARLHADGSLDESFNAGAIIDGLALDSPDNYPTIDRVIGLSDETFLICGQFTHVNGHRRGNIAKLGASGALVETFASHAGADGVIRNLAIQEDGKIVLVGAFEHYAGESAQKIVRIHADGTRDDSFLSQPGPSGWASSLKGVALQPDGKLIVTGFFQKYHGEPVSNVARLHPNGSVDTTFATVEENIGSVVNAVVTPDGKIYVFGFFEVFNDVNRPRICRLHPNGTVDRSFLIRGGVDAEVYSVLTAPNGDLIMGGAFYEAAGTRLGNLARFKPDGTLDSSFDVGFGAGDHVLALAFKDSHKLMVGGQFHTYNGFEDTHITQLNIDHLDPVFSGIHIDGGDVEMTLRGIAGETVQLEQSSDLRAWTGDGNTLFEEDEQTIVRPYNLTENRYYRIVEP